MGGYPAPEGYNQDAGYAANKAAYSAKQQEYNNMGGQPPEQAYPYGPPGSLQLLPFFS